ncbi:RNA methyltransferase [bacterium]|nr:RNA methyltransferase [bacterium]
MKITSVNNDLIKETAKLQNKKSEKFLIEGQKAIQESIDAGIKIETLFVLEGKEDLYKFYPDFITVPEHVMKKISTTDSAPTGLAVGYKKVSDNKNLKTKKTVVLLEGIKDAGNLGTIIRSAAAFGINDIVLYGNTVDEYNPKCIRSCAGNFWKINVYHIKDFEELKNYFSDFERIATLPHGKTKMSKTQKNKLIMFGSEADGLSDELKKFSTEILTIETNNTVESLNLSISAGIVFYKHFTEQ